MSEEHGYKIPCGVRTLKVGMAEKLGFTGYGPSSTSSLCLISQKTASLCALSTHSAVLGNLRTYNTSPERPIPGSSPGRRVDHAAGLNSTTFGYHHVFSVDTNRIFVSHPVTLFTTFRRKRWQRKRPQRPPRRLARLPPVVRHRSPLRPAANAYLGVARL